MRFSDRKAFDDRIYDYLTRTGWEKCDRNYDAAVYSIRILDGYYTEVYAVISVDEEGLFVEGDLGVRFLEGEYEYKDRALCEDGAFYGKNIETKELVLLRDLVLLGLAKLVKE